MTRPRPVVELAPVPAVAPGDAAAPRIPFARVDCSGNELEYVRAVLESGWLTTAARAKELERRVAERVGARHALAVNSCTSGLHLALDALGVSRGDRVFVPSMTFTASAEVIRYLGAEPVVLDVDPFTSSLSVEIVERAIAAHPQVKTLIGVHFGGRAMPMVGPPGKGLVALCRHAGVRIVEDAAHALPTRLGGRPVGTFGDVTVFSFYANKTMTTGEGGMVTTQSDQYAERIRLMRLHGINRDVWDRFTSRAASWEYDVVAPGYKYNMADLNAAVGLAQLERLDAMHRERVRCARRYLERLAGLEQLVLPTPPPRFEDHSWHLFPVRVRPEAALSRNEVIDRLAAAGIGTSVHYKPIHRLAYYRDRYSLDASDFPGAERLWQETISLPIYNLLTDAEIDTVCGALADMPWG